MDPQNFTRGEDGSQRNVGPEGDGLFNCMHRSCDSACQIAAECRQGICWYCATSQCSGERAAAFTGSGDSHRCPFSATSANSCCETTAACKNNL
ncbi:unnamed protein product [Staurois parvus]|uniref:Uncharacterized protein n=1 Tax=Staurois parvus TaxID=386267 RepID=A0ABN9F8N4_9NEOB|nr:unnamed protein product [Staurois parvus]